MASSMRRKREKTTGSLCREDGITETTFYRWQRKCDSLTISEAGRLKELEKKRENAQMKRLLAERDLETDALQAFLSISDTAFGSSGVGRVPECTWAGGAARPKEYSDPHSFCTWRG